MKEALVPNIDKIPRYDIHVRLLGTDGNAFMVMGLVTKAMRRAGVTSEEIDKYREESMAGDYDNLLMTAMRWVDVG